MGVLRGLISLLSVALVVAVDPIVDLSYSKYEGTALPNGVSQWLGIRYAAPPLGNLRFAAPTPVPYNSTIQKADKHGFLCLANQKGPGLQYGSARQPMDEDCLFVDVWAPTNATTTSRLPIMVFIQGGGWSSNSNGNFNGSLLVSNSGLNMIVITLNYRVGLLGLLASKEVVEGGSLNNGLKDVMFVLQWVQDRANLFGGDTNHVVLSGDSVGALIITHLMAAHNGTGLPGFFHGAAAESSSFAGDAQVVDVQSKYDDLVKAVGCTGANNTLSCLRGVNVTELQTKSPSYGWSPVIDNDILVAPLYQLYEQRRFRHVPTIYGSTTDEGTKNVDKTVTTATLDRAIRNSLGNITDAQLAELKTVYPASLNNVTFSGAVLNSSYPDAGNEWQRFAALAGELGSRCINAFQSDMISLAGNTQNWHYHYDVIDPRDEATGNRVYHVVELNAIWGPNNTDGSPPPAYKVSNENGGIGGIVPVMQSYWISFVRTLNPNTLRMAGTTKWETWGTPGLGNGAGERRRLRFGKNGTGIVTEMEGMTQEEMERCGVVIKYAKARNMYAQPLREEIMPAFANGTFPDPYA
ncbi:Alpha/Beta hydrolase protein [Tricladium varicosporioides]|nr:Alpha/Beta hydrolase protein [Hymenoscyphus varicosporioides]